MRATRRDPRYSTSWSGLRMSKTPMVRRLAKKAAAPAQSATSCRGLRGSGGGGWCRTVTGWTLRRVAARSGSFDEPFFGFVAGHVLERLLAGLPQGAAPSAAAPRERCAQWGRADFGCDV